MYYLIDTHRKRVLITLDNQAEIEEFACDMAGTEDLSLALERLNGRILTEATVSDPLNQPIIHQ